MRESRLTSRVNFSLEDVGFDCWLEERLARFGGMSMSWKTEATVWRELSLGVQVSARFGDMLGAR